jgi:hypothetical protein
MTTTRARRALAAADDMVAFLEGRRSRLEHRRAVSQPTGRVRIVSGRLIEVSGLDMSHYRTGGNRRPMLVRRKPSGAFEPVAAAVATTAGLFKVCRTDAGRETLTLIEDGMLERVAPITHPSGSWRLLELLAD